MRSPLVLAVAFAAPLALCQTTSAILKVSPAGLAKNAEVGAPHIKAVLPNAPIDEHKAIRFYSASESFTFRNSKGTLVRFWFTSPGINGARVSVEADQSVLGGVFYHQTLYVCAPESAQSSIPVMNRLLRSTNDPKPLTKAETLTIALLLAKCSNTLQVYGDPQARLRSAQKRMKGVAALPSATMDGTRRQVVFYTWSALPAPEIRRWTTAFGPNEILKAESAEVARTSPQ